jgi:two-component system, chemotaxis family, protein-glutamate methylesterase/glutaminase
MAGPDIIVIGASAGGVEALMRIVRGLPSDLQASVFVVVHVSPGPPSSLPDLLTRVGKLPASHAQHLQQIQHGRIYVAPPDRHLVVVDGRVHVTIGPRENGHRPAIDPLFRTAARSYGRRVVGIVLSGALDDGTAGLAAVKQRGGLAIVQDPEDALFPSMPRSAMDHVVVDHVLPAEGIGTLLTEVVEQPVTDLPLPIPSATMEVEARMADLDRDAVHELERPGTPSVFACPECGGVSWELEEGDLLRFRCRVGHAYSPDTLSAKKLESLEDALWVALRALEEQAALAQRLAHQAAERGHHRLVNRFSERQDAAHHRAELIRQVLADTSTFQELASGE